MFCLVLVTFICIYWMQKLLQGHRFLFLLEYLFPLCKLLFWLRNTLLPASKAHLDVAGRALVWVNPTRSPVSSGPPVQSGALFTRMCSMIRESTPNPLSSALLSALLSRGSKNSALFLGRRPRVQALCLAKSTIVPTR